MKRKRTLDSNHCERFSQLADRPSIRESVWNDWCGCVGWMCCVDVCACALLVKVKGSFEKFRYRCVVLPFERWGDGKSRPWSFLCSSRAANSCGPMCIVRTISDTTRTRRPCSAVARSDLRTVAAHLAAVHMADHSTMISSPTTDQRNAASVNRTAMPTRTTPSIRRKRWTNESVQRWTRYHICEFDYSNCLSWKV